MSVNSTDLGNGDFATGIPYKPPVLPKELGPDTPCEAYYQMAVGWSMVDDLWGGTVTMQQAGRKWLPQDPGESDEQYTARLDRSVFFNAFKRTVQMLIGKPFFKPVKIAATMPEFVKPWLTDIDREGHKFDVFLKESLTKQVKDGHAILFVDYPPVDDAAISEADKKRLNIRPYIVSIDPRNLLFWHSEVVNGRRMLTEVRWLEVVMEPYGEWSEKPVTYIRRLQRGVWNTSDIPNADGGFDSALSVKFTVYEKIDGKDKTQWVVVRSGFLKNEKDEFITEIPMACAYGAEKGFYESELPLNDLMFVNIDHWRSSSDQRHILHVSRVPIKFARGFIPGQNKDGSVPAKINLGPDRVVATEQPQADFKYVEPPAGTAIDSGRQNLEDLKIEMSVLGAEKLVKKQVFSTATENIHSNAGEDSELGSMCSSLEDAFNQCIRYMAMYVGESEADIESIVDCIELNTDFGVFPWQLQILAHLITIWQAGAIDQKTLLEEFQRLGALSDVLNLEDVIQLAQKEYSDKERQMLKTSSVNRKQVVPVGPQPTNQAGA